MFAFAEIGIDGMLGLDFLKDYDCSLDMASSSLKIKKNAMVCIWKEELAVAG